MTSLHSRAPLAIVRALGLLLGVTTASAQGLLWTTCFGGTGVERIEWGKDTMTLAANGDTLIAGFTTSPPVAGNQDGFVARLRPNGALVWTMRIGGAGPDGVRALLEEPNGNLLIGGFTNAPPPPATGLPLPATPGAFQTVHGGSPVAWGYGDAFVGRLTNAVTGPPVISWLTYLGGNNDESVTCIARQPSGRVVVGGWTLSQNFPVAGTPYQPLPLGGYDGFVAVFDPSMAGPAQMPYATRFGGNADDFVAGVAIAGTDIVVAGDTRSAGLFAFPLQPFQGAYAGNSDAFVAAFNASLSSRLYGSYLGGNEGEWLYDLERTPSGMLVLVGETRSPNLPTANPLQAYVGGGTYGDDAFVALLDPLAQQLVYGTYFGGNGDDLAFDVVVERSGLLTFVGAVGSQPQPAIGGMPTTPGAYSRTFRGGSTSNGGPWDAFVARLDPSQPASLQLAYSSFLGGALGRDVATQAALTARGTIVVAGLTQSSDFPLSTFFGGGEDAYVAELDLLPAPLVRYGAASPACHGGLYLGVNSQPSAGSVGFEVHVNDAPAAANGALLLGTPSAAPIPIPGLGITAWVMLAPAPLALPGAANGNGFARFAFPPLPPTFTWPVLGLQSVWLGNCAPLVASDALR